MHVCILLVIQILLLGHGGQYAEHTISLQVRYGTMKGFIPILHHLITVHQLRWIYISMGEEHSPTPIYRWLEIFCACFAHRANIFDHLDQALDMHLIPAITYAVYKLMGVI
jgi:hypothetical protein